MHIGPIATSRVVWVAHSWWGTALPRAAAPAGGSMVSFSVSDPARGHASCLALLGKAPLSAMCRGHWWPHSLLLSQPLTLSLTAWDWRSRHCSIPGAPAPDSRDAPQPPCAPELWCSPGRREGDRVQVPSHVEGTSTAVCHPGLAIALQTGLHHFRSLYPLHSCRACFPPAHMTVHTPGPSPAPLQPVTTAEQ